MELSPALIKKASGQYDLELVKRLVLANARLGRLAHLEKCLHLHTLVVALGQLYGVSLGPVSQGCVFRRHDLSHSSQNGYGRC